MTRPKRKAKNDRRRQRNEVRAAMASFNSLKSQAARHALRKMELLNFKQQRKLRRASAINDPSIGEIISNLMKGFLCASS